MQFGFAAEAQSGAGKGRRRQAADRRPLASACWQPPSSRPPLNLANEPKTLAAANAAPQGDDLVKIGENMIGEGKAKDAIGVIQNGMKKPLKDQANAQIRLGQAYLAAGQKGDAASAFDKVKTPEKDAMVAHLWSLATKH